MWRGVVLAAMLWPGAAVAVCAPDAVTFHGGQIRFTVEIADTAAERSLGLMHRDSIGASQAMLFVYDTPGHPHFWMKDTLVPLDMVFIEADGMVAKVHPQAQPLDETAIDGGEGVQYVLEIKGGLAATLGLVPGDAMVWAGLSAPAEPCN